MDLVPLAQILRIVQLAEARMLSLSLFVSVPSVDDPHSILASGYLYVAQLYREAAGAIKGTPDSFRVAAVDYRSA